MRRQHGFLGISVMQGILGLSLVAAVGGYITYCQWAKNDREKIITQIEEQKKTREKELKKEIAAQQRINKELSDGYQKERQKLVAGYDAYVEQLRIHANQSAIADALPTGTSVDEELVCLDRAKLAEQMAGFERRAEEGLIRILAEGDNAKLIASKCLAWTREQRKASELIRSEAAPNP